MLNCFLAFFFHNNKVFLTLDHFSLTLRNFIEGKEILKMIVRPGWLCGEHVGLMHDLVVVSSIPG